MLCLLCPQILSILIVVVSYFVFAIVHASYAAARLEDSMGQGQYQERTLRLRHLAETFRRLV